MRNEKNCIHILLTVINNESYYSELEVRVANFILDNLIEINSIYIEDIAASCYTSTSTLSRIIIRFGFENIKDFRNRIESYNSYLNEVEKSKLDTRDLINQYKEDNLKMINETQKKIDYNLYDKIITKIHEANHIIFLGIENSNIVAQDAQLKFLYANKISTVPMIKNSSDEIINNIKDDDLLFIISNSGKTELLVEIVENMKKNKNIILLTGSDHTKLESYSELTIKCEYDNLYQNSTMIGRTSALIVIDILFTLYINKYSV